MSYATGCHTVFHHRYHIVWVTKYRYKVLGGTLRERIRTIIRQVCKELGVYRSSRAFCPKSMSPWSSRHHRISRSAISFAVSKGARRIAFRWSSQNFANVTGVAISGRGATSALPAATSQTRRYFSISSIMNLPASAGSYSVLRHRKEAMTANTLFFITSEGGSCFANRFQNFE